MMQTKLLAMEGLQNTQGEVISRFLMLFEITNNQALVLDFASAFVSLNLPPTPHLPPLTPFRKCMSGLKSV